MIKAIIFDCFGVFYTDPVFSHMRDLGTPASEAEALHDLDKQAALGLLDKNLFINKAAVLFDDTPKNIENQFFIGHDLNMSLVNFVKDIRKEYKTALLSNIGGDMMEGFFSKSDYRDLFDQVILSGDVKLAKPDPRIFILTCNRLNIEPHEALMVDDMQSNIDAVHTLGMSGICYKEFEQFKSEFQLILATK